MLTFAPPCPCRATTFRAFAVPVPSICRRSTLHIARRTRSQSTLLMVARPVWEVVQGCDVVLPAETGSGPPKALVHFIGGLGAGAAPKRLYAAFLERLAERGQVAVVATPVGTGFDHDILSRRAAELSSDVIRVLQNRWNTPWIPVIGVGHSLGAKLHVLANSSDEMRPILGPRVANVLIAFNNFSAAQSIPMWSTLQDAAARGTASLPPEVAAVLNRMKNADVSPETLEGFGAPPQVASFVASAAAAVSDIAEGIGGGGFRPSEEEVLRRARDGYSVNRNLIISFTRDTLDCADVLLPLLRGRFGEGGATVRRLPGTHITPNTPDLEEELGSTGVGAVDGTVRGARDAAVAELDDTVTVVVAFLRLNLELLVEQRQLPTAQSDS